MRLFTTMRLRQGVQAARQLVFAAWLALLLAQWGALHHAVEHAPALQGATQAAHNERGPAAEEHHAGAPVCQLFDHLLLAQTAGHMPLRVPQAQWSTDAPAPALQPALPARPLQAYEARGPPRA